MIFCLIGANGMMLASILLPLALSYSATILRKAASSSGMKPWVHHTLAVVAAALAKNGRPRLAAAAAPRERRSSKRRFSLAITILPYLNGVVLRDRLASTF